MSAELRNTILASAIAALLWVVPPYLEVNAQTTDQSTDQSSGQANGNAPAGQQDNQQQAQPPQAQTDQQIEELTEEQLANQDEEQTAGARFIPTEQISQDLGVSFPVDI